MKQSTPKISAVEAATPARNFQRGALTLIAGCMFSGKTTELLRRVERHDSARVVAVKHRIDTRYSLGEIVSHGGKACPACVVEAPKAIEPLVTDQTELVAIDEAHFFGESIVSVIRQLRDDGMDVVVTTLDRDSWGRPFPVATRLLELADESVLLHATCSRCGQRADRTQRLTPIVDDQMVGGPESYEARCTACWHPPPEAPP